MDYNQFRNPKAPRPGKGKSKTATGKLRVLSYLWNTTVPGNRFGTDGPQPAVPPVWPGDNLRACRQWHGIDISADFRANGSVDKASITLSELSYSGKTETVGLIGKTTVTDRHVTEPLIVSDASGTYVQVKTLLGTRLGAFIPDIDVGVPATDPDSAVAQKILEEFIEQVSEERYLGTHGWTPKIFSYAFIRLYADKVIVGWVSNKRGNGFKTQEEIIEEQLATSWIPEHHLYANDQLRPLFSHVPTSKDHADELEKWVDSNRPADVFAFKALTVALEEWARDTPLKKKEQTAKDFKRRYPDYFIAAEF